AEIEKLENVLKLITYNIDKGSQLENLLSRTFNTVEDIISLEAMTNAQLKQIIQKIIITHDGNCDIYLRLFGDIGLDETFLIAHPKT
ncbi:MAG: recombinase family protein, partial [Clostridiales bacterium]|nr:recombinase family protein [Clostridiales bacterium]